MAAIRAIAATASIEGSGLGDWLIAPEGTADCPEVVSFREWLRALLAENPLATAAALVWSASSEVEATATQKEFGVEGPEVTIFRQASWYIDRSDRKSAVTARQDRIRPGSRAALPSNRHAATQRKASLDARGVHVVKYLPRQDGGLPESVEDRLGRRRRRKPIGFMRRRGSSMGILRSAAKRLRRKSR